MLFGLWNGFGMHRKVTVIPKGVPEAPGMYWALLGHVEGTHQPTWAGAHPLRQPRPIRWKGEAPPPPTISLEGRNEGEGALPPFLLPCALYGRGVHHYEIPRMAPDPIGGALGKPPPFPHLYIYMWGGVPHNTQLIPCRVSAPLRH